MSATSPDSRATHPIWCTDHLRHADCDWHSTTTWEVAGAQINMCDGEATLDGSIRIYGLHNIGTDESISLGEAESLAMLLMSLVGMANRSEDVR